MTCNRIMLILWIVIVGYRISSKNSPRQTMCAHMVEELLRRIAANRLFVANIA